MSADIWFFPEPVLSHRGWLWGHTNDDFQTHRGQPGPHPWGSKLRMVVVWGSVMLLGLLYAEAWLACCTCTHFSATLWGMCGGVCHCTKVQQQSDVEVRPVSRLAPTLGSRFSRSM
jgi:hypothetical protein